MTAQEALLRYARELDRQTVLVRRLLEVPEAIHDPAGALLCGSQKLGDKLLAAVRALTGAL